MALPTGWDETAEITSREKYVREYKNWSWNAGYGHTIGTAKFDFRVSTYVDGKNSVEVDNENKWAVSFTYQIVNISGPTRGFGSSVVPTQAEYIKEMMMLSYASVNPLPKRGNSIFDESFTGTGTEEDPIVYSTTEPVIDTISLSQAGTSDVWHMVFSAKKISAISWTKNTPEATEVPTSQLQISPWEIEETVRISCSTEDYMMGGGYKISSPKTPSDVNTYIKNATGGAAFVSAANGTYEVVKNTAGDPFRSPPSMKVGVTTYVIEKSFQNDVVLTGLVSGAKAAMTEVNSSSITFSSLSTSYSVPAGNAMLTGFSINPASFVEKADWLPNQKHPFGKKYSELGWTSPASKEQTDIAINSFSKVLEANRTVVYKVVSATIVERVVGWGVFIPNKGYRQLLAGVKDAIREKDKTKTDESFLDTNGAALADDATTGHLLLGWTPYSAGGNLKTLMSDLFAASQLNP